MVKRNYGNAVVYLVCKGVHRVVNDHHVFHPSIRNNAQILYVVPLWCLNAVLPVKPILKEFVFRIDIVENGIRIGLVRRCKHNYLERFVCLLQALHKIGS